MTSKPLLGFTVAVTAARRADEFATMLERRGAVVVSAPAIAMVPLVDDVELQNVTADLIANPPDVLVATTGIGFRGWIEAAQQWGVATELLAALAEARVISRGSKATGALRAVGLREQWAAPNESSAEIVTYLSNLNLSGARIAVQRHGATDDWDPVPDLRDRLSATGACVINAPVYRWELPTDTASFDSLVQQIARADIDAVTFTSAPAVSSTMQRAGDLGVAGDVRRALAGPVVPYCVGPVTALPLRRWDVVGIAPERMRLGALARLVAEDLPRRRRPTGAGLTSP